MNKPGGVANETQCMHYFQDNFGEDFSDSESLRSWYESTGWERNIEMVLFMIFLHVILKSIHN